VQNMSLFQCPHCNNGTEVFGSNERVKKVCQEHSIELIGDIPLHQSIGDDSQQGKPTVVADPAGPQAQAFLDIAQNIGAKIGL
jgi:ATP-binding protein involved in chromosome partitioning